MTLLSKRFSPQALLLEPVQERVLALLLLLELGQELGQEPVPELLLEPLLLLLEPLLLLKQHQEAPRTLAATLATHRDRPASSIL